MIYLKFLDTEYEDIDGKFLDCMELSCLMHGFIESWSYDAVVPWRDINEIVNEHMLTMHYS